MSIGKKIGLRHGETFIELRRHTFFAYLFQYILGILVLFVDSFFLFWLMGQGIFGYAIIALGILIGLYLIIRAFRRQRKNYWILTDQRIIDIDKTGWLEESVASIELDSIVDIVVTKKGLGAKIFNYGNLQIETGNEEFLIIIDKVRKPKKFADLLQELCQTSKHKQIANDLQSILDNFVSAIPEYTLKQLEQIHDRISAEIENIERDVESI